jgi:uncharacterized protein YycO
MLFIFILCFLSFAGAAKDYMPQNGDIIFQTSKSSQSKAIQIATNSPYSHVGIVYIQDGKAYVYEAISSVQLTPLSKWVDRGEGDKITVMRSKKELSSKQIQSMLTVGKKYNGKKYDLAFQWSNDKMYCSELVWKVYKDGAGIKLTTPNQFQDYNFTHPKVYPLVKQRWGSEINLKEKVVAPSDLHKSNKLTIIYTDFE